MAICLLYNLTAHTLNQLASLRICSHQKTGSYILGNGNTLHPRYCFLQRTECKYWMIIHHALWCDEVLLVGSMSILVVIFMGEIQAKSSYMEW